MQRRVAAIYFAFFLVMGAGAYSVMALAQEPTVDVSGDRYENGTQFTLGGERYHVTGLKAEESSGGGGHGGGGGGGGYTGEITWTNESYQFNATLKNNTTVPYQNATYRVNVPNESNVSSFTLQQEYNVSQVLKNDSAVENETVTRADGRKYVVYKNGTTQLVENYLPSRDSQQFSEGDSMAYKGNQTTVDNVSQSGVRLTWTGKANRSVSLSEGANVTLSGTQYTVHFINEHEVLLTQNYKGYQQDLAKQAAFHERINGLWGVIILSGAAAVLIISLAYMPVRG